MTFWRYCENKHVGFAFLKEAHQTSARGAGQSGLNIGGLQCPHCKPIASSHSSFHCSSQPHSLRETDIGLFNTRQAVAELGNARALPLLMKEACRISAMPVGKPPPEQRSILCCPWKVLESLSWCPYPLSALQAALCSLHIFKSGFSIICISSTEIFTELVT